MTHEPAIEGEAQEISTDVAVNDPAPSLTLFRTSDPVEVLERASRVADALKGVIVKQQLFKVINSKPHVFVEAWATCGAMLGLTSYVVWSRPIGEKGEHGHDWEARVEVHALDGRVISAAEAMCTRKESKWKTRDDYAVRSMAQTRATSKAFRGPLGFIVTLAGYSATPAEEMPESSQQSDVPSTTRVEPEKIGAAKAAELLLNSDSAGISREALQKATAWALGVDSLPESFESDEAALYALAQLTGVERTMRWIEKQRAKTKETVA